MTYNRFLFSLLAFCFFYAKAQVLVLDDSSQSVSLRTKFSIFEDKQNQYTINHIRSKEFKDSFVVYPHDPYIQNLSSTYWVKLEIQNNSLLKDRWLLEWWDFRIGQIEFYDGIHTKPQILGNSLPFSDRLLKHKNILFEIEPPPASNSVLYFKINSQNPFWLNGTVKSYPSFMEKALNEYAFLVLFYGIMFALFLYNILLYITTRNISIIFYSTYLLCVFAIMTAKDNLGFQFIWSNFPELNPWLLPIGELGMIVFLGIYTLNFLQLKQRSVFLFRLVLAVIVIRIFFFGILFMVEYEMLYTQWFDLVPMVCFLVVGIISLRTGFRQARYFVLAMVFMSISFLITSLVFFNIIPLSAATLYSLNFGVMADLFFLSLSISDTIRATFEAKEKAQQELIIQISEKERLKDKVNRELEEKVKERTLQLNQKAQELETSNQQLELLSQKLKEANVSLDGQNWKLSKELVEKKRSIILDEELSFSEFFEVYPDDLACFRFLEDMKWEDGFHCRKCGHTHYNETERKFNRKCTRCDFIESVTSNTLFHGIKFPLPKAFYLVYITAIAEKRITVKKLSEDLDLRYNTCVDFRKKIIERKSLVLKKSGHEKIDKWETLIID